MARALHLISCYLPNDPFVDGFLQEVADALGERAQQLLLLPTYAPQRDALPFAQISYTLEGYRRLAPAAAALPYGLVPAALAGSESAWSRQRCDEARTARAIGACAAFFGRLLDELEPDSVSVWNPAVPQGRLLKAACELRGIPSFAIERGVFPDTMMLDAHEIGARSDIALNHALRRLLLREPARRQRLDELRAHYAQRTRGKYPAAPAEPERIRERYRVPHGSRVAVLFLSVAAGNWDPPGLPAHRYTSPWFRSDETAIDALLAALPADTVLLVQHHPIDRATARAPRHPRLRHTAGEPLDCLFAAADLLCFLGATTVQHEALLTSKPVLLLSRSQLSGLGVAYEHGGNALQALVADALACGRSEAQDDAIARYVPFLFEHVLFGRAGGPARLSGADFAAHLAALAAGHDLDVGERLARWLNAVQNDAAEVTAPA